MKSMTKNLEMLLHTIQHGEKKTMLTKEKLRQNYILP